MDRDGDDSPLKESLGNTCSFLLFLQVYRQRNDLKLVSIWLRAMKESDNKVK